MARSAILFVGLSGATASTTVSTILEAGRSQRELRCTTSGVDFEGIDLLGAQQFAFGGWDYIGRSVHESTLKHGIDLRFSDATISDTSAMFPLPGIRTHLDIPAELSHSQTTPVTDPVASVQDIAAQIRMMRESLEADHVCVVYAGSPYASGVHAPVPSSIRSWDGLASLGATVPSSLLYGLGAAAEGSDFVDFTPGRVLEAPLLLKTSLDHGSQLAGADGSTGQTMLKHALSGLFRSRGLKVRGWYSTNVIGNHDGYVLNLPGHDEIKLEDKRRGASAVLGYDDFDHHVSIDYVPRWGDRKESWDSIELEGWAGTVAELRVNWRGTDSLLASALIFDLVRLLRQGWQRGLSGHRLDLGFFFKNPHGRSGRSLDQLYSEMVQVAHGGQ